MKRKSLRALAITLATVQMLMLVPTAKVSASTDSLTGEENLEEDTGGESTDDESTDEESTDEVTHLLKVIDQYLDEEGAEERSEVRYEDSILENEEYLFSALDIEGYDLVSDAEFSGVVTEDTTLIFTYAKTVENNNEVTYLLKVIDQYLNEEGAEEKSEVRYEEIVPEGKEYSFDALDVEGYELVNDAGFSGVVTEDTTLIFTYAMAESNEVSYLIKVIDQYFNEDGSEEKSEVRYEEIVPEGKDYSFSALDAEGYTLTSNADVSGLVTGDTTLVFTYTKNVDAGITPFALGDTHTVTFYAAGVEYDTQEVADGDKITIPAEPTRNGHRFLHWSKDKSTCTLFQEATCAIDFDAYTVTEDVKLYAHFRGETNVITIRQTRATNAPVIEDIVSDSPKYPAVEINGVKYIKINKPDNFANFDRADEGYTVSAWAYANEDFDLLYYYDATTGTCTKLGSAETFTDFTNLYAKAYKSGAIYPIWQKSQCVVTINDAYYEADGTTPINTALRSTETVTGGTEYSYSALNPDGYELIGYSTGTSSSIKKKDTVSGTLSDDLTITFMYKKVDAVPTPDSTPDSTSEPTPDPQPSQDPAPTPEPIVEESETPEIQTEESGVVEMKIVEKPAEIAPVVEEPKTGDVGGFNMQLLLAFVAFDSLLAAVYLFWGRKFVD